jgi:hypothetical protein
MKPPSSAALGDSDSAYPTTRRRDDGELAVSTWIGSPTTMGPFSKPVSNGWPKPM